MLITLVHRQVMERRIWDLMPAYGRVVSSELRKQSFEG